MRFVDVPAGPTPRRTPAPSPVGFHSEISLVPDDVPTQRMSPSREAGPSATPSPMKRAPAKPQEPSGMSYALRKAWSSARWTLATWLYSRARATRMAGRRVVDAARITEPEPAYVTFASH